MRSQVQILMPTDIVELTWMHSGCKEPISRRECVGPLVWFWFSGYLWISVSKLIEDDASCTTRHVRVFSCLDEFLVFHVVRAALVAL